MSDYCKFRTLEETVARLVAESGLTLRQITRTLYIRKSLLKDFPTRTIPKNQSGMMNLIMNYYHQAEDEKKEKLKKLKLGEKKFSATLDEWTK